MCEFIPHSVTSHTEEYIQLYILQQQTNDKYVDT